MKNKTFANKANLDKKENLKSPKQNIIDKDTWRSLKRMNREQFSDYMVRLYNNIYDTFCENAQADIDMDAIREEISQLKGIGEVRLNAIMEIINEHTHPPKVKDE